MSDHPWNDWRVTAYALGELDESACSAFERELTTDPQLQEAVAEASRITRAVTASLGREPAPTLSDVHRAELFSHFSGEGPMNAPVQTKHAGRRGRSGVRLAIAASLCLLIAGAAWIAARPHTLNSLALFGDQASEQPVYSSAEETANRRGVRRMDGDTAFARRPGPVAADAAPSVARSTSGPAPPTERNSEAEASESSASASSPHFLQPEPWDFKADATAPYGGAEADDAEVYGTGYGAASNKRAEYYSRSADGMEPRRSRRGRVADFRARSAVPGIKIIEGAEIGGHGGGFGGSVDPDQGRGPGRAGDRFDPITDNPFLRVADNPLSTFSIDVDTASYSKVRQYLLEQNRLPRPDAVRIEELVNYFGYSYEPPAEDAEHPFAASIAIASCPWNPEHRLARIGIKGRTVENDQRPPSNLVFLLDVSGSMDQPNRLPLVRRGMQLLLEQLGENDRVAIIVYAGAAGMVLDSTPADRRQEIFNAIERLRAGGSTNGGQGIQLAYATARDNFITGGTNRVILCTDGDFNVGTTGTDQLVRMVENEANGGIFLSVLGFGMGNHNDAMLEQISGRGNGNYAFIDTEKEAQKVLVQQTAGTLVTIAKDVKIQVEFNPGRVAGYRLIGYKNRLLAKEDFNDDTKDAGEIGAGHTVTALYELVPAGEPVEPAAPDVDPLKYQRPTSTTDAAESDELLTLKLRYKQPDGDQSTLVEFPAEDTGESFHAADGDFQFAAAVAGFGMLLRDSPYKGNWTFAAIDEVAGDADGEDAHGFRSEFRRMVRKAAELAGE